MTNTTNKLALCAALALVAVAGLHRAANATPGFQLSPAVGVPGTCGGAATVAQIGYWADPGLSPKTGDTAYIKAVAQLGCAVSDSPGFDFILPAGVDLAISAQNPVVCLRGRGTTSENVPNDSTGACLQSPTTGNVGGLFFGWSKLSSTGNQWVEIKAVTSTYAGPLTSVIDLDVGYRAAFGSYSGIGLYGNLMIGFELRNFYESGTLYIDYGTSANFGTTNAPTAVPSGYYNYPNVSTTISGLTAGATYYWRVRFVTAWGTFVGPTQTAVIATQGPGCSVRGRC
jgi:hypothetical protein